MDDESRESMEPMEEVPHFKGNFNDLQKSKISVGLSDRQISRMLQAPVPIPQMSANITPKWLTFST